ncbi:MAG TPA: sigma-54 dependent transcriptional regulator [Longimicrobiales bacterium]
MNATDRERILVVDDDASFRRTLAEVLDAHGYEAAAAHDAADALERLQAEPVDLVITDVVMPGVKGDALLRRIRETFPELPTIAVTAFGTIDGALELTRAGAADYLTKPFRTQALLDSVARVLDESRPRRLEARARRGLGDHLDGIVGASRPMLRLFDRIGRVARSPAPVLITGETGTGKELVARAVHRASGRGPFVPVNCGALPDALLESELFGYRKGAFTGAESDKPGLFESAEGGTLFLDEIGELPLALQPKLLRAIETGEVRRVGGVETRRVDVRIIAATHRDLEHAVERGAFRDDLYWRLAVLHLDVPPLRDRPADIPLLVERFLADRARRDAGREATLAPAALGALVEFDWPGNVRQLFATLERAATFATGPVIGTDDLPAEIRRAGAAAILVRSAADRALTLEALEREYILEVLRRTGGNKTRAAEWLGIPRRTLYRRLDAYDVAADGE